MIFRERKLLNKNFIIAGAVVLVVGLAVAIGVSLVDEPLDGNLPEGETTITGQGLPEYAGEMMTMLQEVLMLQFFQDQMKILRLSRWKKMVMQKFFCF